MRPTTVFFLQNKSNRLYNTTIIEKNRYQGFNDIKNELKD